MRLPTIITSAHNIFFFFFLCTVNCVFDSLNEEGIDGEDWEQIISKYQKTKNISDVVALGAVSAEYQELANSSNIVVHADSVFVDFFYH